MKSNVAHFNNKTLRIFTDPEILKIYLVFLLAFCILAISLAFFILSVGKPFMGVELNYKNQEWAIIYVDTNGIANQVGIKEGDRPVEINHTPAQTFLERYREPGVVYGILIKELIVTDSSSQLKSADIENAPNFHPAFVVQISTLILCFIFWITGFFVFFKRPRNKAALLFCLCSSIFGLILCADMAAQITIPLAAILEIVATIIDSWILLHFFLVLPEERAGLFNKPITYLIYLPAFITLVLFPLIGWADGQPLPGFRNFRFIEIGLGFLITAAVAVFNYYHAASVKTRQQMKIVLISCLVALVPFLIVYLLPQTVSNQYVIPPGFSILFLGFIPIGMAYAVLTQKLMDIDVIIRRSVIYVLISLIMAAILSMAILPIMAFGPELGTPTEIILALVLGGVATALFGPAKRGMEYLLDKFFYKDRYDYRQIIQGLSMSLNSLKDLEDVPRLVVGTVVQTLNLSGGCLFIKTQTGNYNVLASQGVLTAENKQLKLVAILPERCPENEFPNSAKTVDPDIEFIIPLITAEKEVGVLCLCSKVSRQEFSSDDIYLVQGVASLAAVAIRSAMLTHDVSLRDTFVSIASHELRTPLTAIMGYSDLLLKRNFPENVRNQWVNNILDNGQIITDMVDELLNVSRIQSGRVSMKLEGVKISDVIAERLAMVQGNSCKHELVMNIAPELPKALVDRDKYGQVITNLLSNAIKYSPNGGQIVLSVWKDVLLNHIVFSVADQGIGISPEDQISLFTTFHRIQRPETRGIRGSGLGLYIVKEWIEAMGGKIWLESELNKGSIFFVSVPIQRPEIANC